MNENNLEIYTKQPDKKTIIAVCVLMLLGITYNTILAFVNAHIMHVSTSHVMIVEVLIVLTATLVATNNLKYVSALTPTLIFVSVAFILFLWVSLLNEKFAIKSIRDYYNIAIFLLLGTLCNREYMIKSFKLLAILTFVIMILEGYFTSIYVGLFEPAQYYANTRGIEVSEHNDVGVFGNSLGFEGRFTYGIFNTHRLSSLFLEQVSLANFAIILSLFTSACWNWLKKSDRILFILLIAFIVLTNGSRTASSLTLITFLGHFIFPKLPKYTNFFYMPFILIICAVVFYDPSITTMNDDLKGRIGWTMYLLSEMNFESIIGANLKDADIAWDSGFAYIIFTQSIFGLILLWLLTAFVLPQNTATNKRLAHGLNIYIFLNLLTGGAIFSIKTMAPLCFIVGYFCKKKFLLSSNINKPQIG